MPTGKELLTAQEVATALNLSVETIWRYTRESKIPYIELGHKQYRYLLNQVIASLAQPHIKEQQTQYSADKGKKLTYDDYLRLPEEDGYRFEILDGELVRDASPNVPHQRASRRLQRILEDYFATVDPEGEVFSAPLDLTLGDYTVVQPDIFYISGQQEQIVLHTHIAGPPTLVVEIISPSSTRKDRLQKMRIYQQHGIPHYWLVNPEEKTLECFALQGGLYAYICSGMDDEIIEHPFFRGLTLELNVLWVK